MYCTWTPWVQLSDQSGIVQPAAELDLTDHDHGQDPVGPGRVAELQIVARQPPVLVGDEVDHLVHDAVADPGALLAGGAVGVGVERVELHGSDPGPVERVERRDRRCGSTRCRCADRGAHGPPPGTR